MQRVFCGYEVDRDCRFMKEADVDVALQLKLKTHASAKNNK